MDVMVHFEHHSLKIAAEPGEKMNTNSEPEAFQVEEYAPHSCLQGPRLQSHDTGSNCLPWNSFGRYGTFLVIDQYQHIKCTGQHP
ncbi:uncharacterized protein [Narcine bancroftii]|uniref:uncharacterized protein isoform X4 n=1 Tax=Narcine bancroftii TaxID=1343680 RepID=UPI003831AAEA